MPNKYQNWFGYAGLSKEENRKFASNKIKDSKYNPQIIINRVAMQPIKGFKRNIDPSFLSTSQSVPLQILQNPFPPIRGMEQENQLAATQPAQSGARRRRKKTRKV
jgi:hypothetical protein